ncbi:MAG: OFA family MFS transporter [Desulfovibrio sp.]|nr:OFA family MFS transporter [Desulfovibrio sp.]
MFYGWKISILAMGGNFMLQGATIYCMNAFMEPLCEQNGWTRMGINLSLGIAALLGQLTMPAAAAIAERHSLRLLMAAGALAGGLATCGMGLTGDIRLFTVFLVIVWVASQFCGGVVANALMANWFSHFRGVAFGLANAGVSLSGLILPACCYLLIENYGLTTAFLVTGFFTCLLCPLSWLIVRRSPQILNLHPDGRKHEPRRPKKRENGQRTSGLFKEPALWQIGLAFGFALMCASGIISQLKPRFSDLGIDGQTGIALAALSAGMATLAKFVWGWLCDKLEPLLASRLLLLFCFCSMLLLWLPPSLVSLACFAFCFTAFTGGLWVVLPAVTAHYFGSANFLVAYKLVSIFILLRCMSFPVMGISHEILGNYSLADAMFAGLFLAAFILMLLLKPEKAAEKTGRRHLR